ncbi:MAG TPA: acetyl-CoA carboxylase biotin carboxyl carrier protein [Candidatus Omnitrophota bacterium]|nr:acetyl-CoA carboxylase biotin carboxyl carrier protein [Candidatus Omnitrophota bacterium]
MNLKEIKEMITLMNDNGLVELEVEKEGMRIRLKKSAGEMAAVSGPVIIERGKAVLPPGIKDVSAPTAEIPSNITEIKSPMVGTFYRAPSPESPAYVEIGQIIEPGQVICIVEAMKLMNEIKAEVKGKIIDILVDNAEPIEFGQPLFLIEPV